MKKSTELILKLWKSYIIFIISFAVILSLILLYMRQSLSEFTIEKNNEAVSQAISTIEDKIMIINRLATFIESRRSLLLLADLEKEEVNQYQWELYLLRKTFNQLGNLIDFGDYFIYLDKNDVCISPYSICTDVKEFYGSVFQFGTFDFDEFYKYKATLKSNVFLSANQLEFGNEKYRGLFYHIKCYPYRDHKASFFFLLTESYLSKLFHPLNQSQVLLFNDQNQLLYTYPTGSTDFQPYITSNGIDTDSMKKEYIVSDMQSSYGLRYLCMTPKKVVLKDVNRLSWITVIIILGLMFLALLVSFYTSFYNSQFIRNILLNSNKFNDREKVNIYEEMNQLFDNLKKDNLLLQTTMDVTKKKLYRNFFSNLLSGRLEQPHELKIYADDLGIGQEEFGLLVFSTECAFTEITYANIEQLKDFHESWYRCLKELPVKGWVIPLDIGRGAVLAETGEHLWDMADMILKKAETLNGYETMYLGICFTKQPLAVTQIRNGAMDCNARLDRENFSSRCTKIHIQEQLTSYTAWEEYSLPDEKIRILFQAMKNGDDKTAEEVFSQVFQEVLKYSQKKPRLKDDFLTRIRQTLLLANEDGYFFLDPSQDLFMGIRMGQTLYRFLTDIIKDICRHNKELRADGEEEIRQLFLNKTEQYIDADLANPLLSLKYLAGKFGFAPTYFSVIFKQNMNITLSDYLESKRMLKAQELILTSDNGVEEIARLCGYSNTNTFRRTYRRYWGVNPSAMRSMQMGEQIDIKKKGGIE